MAELTQEQEAEQEPTQAREYLRFGAGQRFEHILLLVTFTGLAITGLPQRYGGMDWAKIMITMMGGIESVRVIHRVLATLLIVESIYHGGILSYKAVVLGRRVTMMPGFKDITDALDWVLFNLGIKREHPHMPRYNFGEKAEYLAVVWGTVVMIMTGFMMWNPIAATSIVPGEFIPAARAAHSAEALLAVVSIIIWHMWNVHVRRFNRSMFTGKLSRKDMEEEHAAELEFLDSGGTYLSYPPEVIKRRRLFFWPYAFVMSAILLGILYWFITFEQSAITTLPQRQTAINLDIDPTIGDEALGIRLWNSQDCDLCHGLNGDAAGMPLGYSLANLDINFEEFILATRHGPAEMPAYPPSQVPDEDIAHMWAWLKRVQP
jgi:cytochrome b subunit of formate dehydrogenase